MEIKGTELLQTIQKAKEGNQLAYNTLLDSFWNSVHSFQLKRHQNDNDAEDITIQTFSKAFDKIDTYDEKYQFKTWLITISKNIHIDGLRKKKASVTAELYKEKATDLYDIADDTPSPEDKIITEQNLAKLLKDIKQLKPRYQEIINLRYFQELSYKEISEKIGEPMNNVKIKLLRAKKLLAEIIKRS